MGDFQNVTLGVGKFSINGRDIGLTNGDSQVSRAVETKDLEDGIPLQVQGRVPIRESHELTIPMVELTIQNLSDVSLNVPVTTIPGTPATVTDGMNQERVFRPLFGGDIQFIRLDGQDPTSLVVKNLAETVTYAVGDDYIVDEGAGMVVTVPGGDITPGQRVRVAYGHTPKEADRLGFGVNLPLQEKEVIFTHISPVSGNIFTVFMPRAQFSGALNANFQREEFNVVNVNCKALPDPSYPNSPLGYWEIALAG